MRTPAGPECPYFFGDYYRGRNSEECRLLKASGQQWTADLCRTCPVPAISRANACQFLQLHATVGRPLGAAFQRRVQISASCSKTHRSVSEPQIGCGECHPVPDVFNLK
jgi:hypothetical protein